MASAYTTGARFERHCDNHCDDDDDAYDPDVGYCANRRRLSAVLYCVPPMWADEHGGALRLYRSVAASGGWDGDDALVDVLPRAGRLILFASDQRVPHEVLPVRASGVVRYALALWYLAPATAANAPMTHTGDERADGEADVRDKRSERVSDTSVIVPLL